MGNHSMKNKKPGNVVSVGPVFLSNVYHTAKLGGKRIRLLYKQYEPNTGPNRHDRRAAWPKFRAKYGVLAVRRIREKVREGVPFDTAVKTFLDEQVAGKVYREAKS